MAPSAAARTEVAGYVGGCGNAGGGGGAGLHWNSMGIPRKVVVICRFPPC